MSDFLTVSEVLAIHSILIEKYGGLDGTRDTGLLESAVYRQQNGFYRDIVEEAASLMESLLINHPFIDGNKRTAYGACAVFLPSLPLDSDANLLGLASQSVLPLLHVTLWLKLWNMPGEYLYGNFPMKIAMPTA